VSVISGYDLIEWLMERLNIEESGGNILVCFKITYLSLWCSFFLNRPYSSGSFFKTFWISTHL